jgi:hypothetical protein
MPTGNDIRTRIKIVHQLKFYFTTHDGTFATITRCLYLALFFLIYNFAREKCLLLLLNATGQTQGPSRSTWLIDTCVRAFALFWLSLFIVVCSRRRRREKSINPSPRCIVLFVQQQSIQRSTRQGKAQASELFLFFLVSILHHNEIVVDRIVY